MLSNTNRKEEKYYLFACAILNGMGDLYHAIDMIKAFNQYKKSFPQSFILKPMYLFTMDDVTARNAPWKKIRSVVSLLKEHGLIDEVAIPPAYKTIDQYREKDVSGYLKALHERNRHLYLVPEDEESIAALKNSEEYMNQLQHCVGIAYASFWKRYDLIKYLPGVLEIGITEHNTSSQLKTISDALVKRLGFGNNYHGIMLKKCEFKAEEVSPEQFHDPSLIHDIYRFGVTDSSFAIQELCATAPACDIKMLSSTRAMFAQLTSWLSVNACGTEQRCNPLKFSDIFFAPGYFHSRSGVISFIQSLAASELARNYHYLAFLVPSAQFNKTWFDENLLASQGFSQVSIIQNGKLIECRQLKSKEKKSQGRKICIFMDYPLNDHDFDLVCKMATKVLGCAGDKSLEKAIEYHLLPFYEKPNITKSGVIRGLLEWLDKYNDEILSAALPESRTTKSLEEFVSLAEFIGGWDAALSHRSDHEQSNNAANLSKQLAALLTQETYNIWKKLCTIMHEQYNVYPQLQTMFAQSLCYYRVCEAVEAKNEALAKEIVAPYKYDKSFFQFILKKEIHEKHNLSRNSTVFEFLADEYRACIAQTQESIEPPSP